MRSNFSMLKRTLASPERLFTVALLMRLAVAIILLHAHGPQLFYGGNENSRIAANLAAGLGFSSPYEHVPIAPTAQQPPLYPALLASIFKLFGSYTPRSLWVAVAVNCLAGAATAVLIFRAGHKHFSPEVGMFAAWVWALWPYESLVGLPLANYALSALVATGWLLSAPNTMRRSERKRDWLVLGACAGAAVLLNPSLAAVLLASIAWVKFKPGVLSRPAISAAAFLIILVPWTVRNYLTLHRLVPIRDAFGLELYLGNHPGMSGTVDFTWNFPTLDPRQYAELGEVRFMEAKQHEAIEFITSHPMPFCARVGDRIVEFWTAPVRAPWAAISILAWTGAVLAFRKSYSRSVGLFLLITLAIMPLVYYLTHFWPTYRHPIEPLMLLAAGTTIPQSIAFYRSLRGKCAPS